MNNKIKPETWVGLFLLGGLFMIIGLIIFFGDFKDSKDNSYPLTIEFKDAGTLIPGSVLRLGGAVVGKITAGPEILPSGDKVAVSVLITKAIHIQEGSQFQIAMQNILGDSYIEIIPPSKPTNQYIEPGSTVIGNSQNDLSKLKNNAVIASEEAIRLLHNINDNFANINDAVKHISQSAKDISTTVNKINTEILSTANLTSLESFMVNMDKTSAYLPQLAQETSDSLKELRASIAKADKTITTINEKIDLLEPAFNDVPQIVQGIKKSVANIEQITNETRSGKGTLGLFLFDKQFRANAQEFIRNLRDYGILRYRNPDEPEIKCDPRTGYSGSRR